MMTMTATILATGPWIGFEHLLQRLFPGHARTGSVGGREPSPDSGKWPRRSRKADLRDDGILASMHCHSPSLVVGQE